MTKTCSIIPTFWRAQHIIAMSIRKSLENSRMKLVASRSLNSWVLSLICILMSKTMKKVEGLRGGSRPVYKVCTNLSEFFPKIFLRVYIVKCK